MTQVVLTILIKGNTAIFIHFEIRMRFCRVSKAVVLRNTFSVPKIHVYHEGYI